MLCEKCQRAARGFGFDARLIDKTWRDQAVPACSMKCLDAISKYWKKERKMVDPTEHEVAAAQVGGRCGGEYLESIGKTDLAALDADQWQTFLLCVIGGYTEELAR